MANVARMEIMMREVKFRQRNKNNGSFYYWGFFYSEWIQPLVQDNYISPEESDQYTGLLDKNGVKIYEGDVVLIPKGSYEDESWTYTEEHKEVVVFNEENDGSYNNLPNVAWSDCEVIGSIHENPELLEAR